MIKYLSLLSCFVFLVETGVAQTVQLPGIPEPGLLLYGNIINTNNGIPQRTGTLRISVQLGNSTPVPVTVSLTNINDQYSYVARIPFESVPSSDFRPPEGTALVLSTTPTTYARTAAVNGFPARFVNAQQSNFVFSSAQRGSIERLDLVVGLPLVDSDGDGLDDNWERQFFNGSLSQNGSVDSDGDGMSNLAEQKAGTTPTDRQSRFAFIDVQKVNGGINVRWSSVTNIRYFVERTSFLSTNSNTPSPYLLIQSNITATPPQNSFLDATATNQGPYFYRLRVQ